MSDHEATTGTVRLHRVLRAPADRVSAHREGASGTNPPPVGNTPPSVVSGSACSELTSM